MTHDQVDTAVFDVDGTLVDTNYHHALSWYRAFRRFEIVLPVWRLHRAIGMGGDNLVAHMVVPEDQQVTPHRREAAALLMLLRGQGLQILPPPPVARCEPLPERQSRTA